MKNHLISPNPPRKRRRVLTSALTLLIGLTTLVALVYAVENWRGSRAWTATLEDLRARGEKIALEDFQSSPVPDESNAAMHPALRCFTYTRPDGKRALRLKADPPDAADAAMAAKWQGFLEWRLAGPDPFTKLYDVLDRENRDLTPAREAALELIPALAGHLELMNAVEEALKRPHCQWPPLAVSNESGVSVRGEYFVTIGRSMMEAARFFQVRKICEAIPAGALTAWDEGVVLKRFAQAAAPHQTIGDYLLAAAITGQQEGMVINLLEFTKPDPARCLQAESGLAAQPLLSVVFGECMKGERAFIIAAISSVLAQENPSDLSRIMSGQAPAKGWERVELGIRQYGPVGWLKQNMANTVRGASELIHAYDPAMTPDQRRERASHMLTAVKARGRLFHWMEKDSLGIYGGLYESVLRSDARRNLLRGTLLIAAHRFTAGTAPMSLEELPADLRTRIPMSPLKGDAPRIHRDDAGVWTLSYVGSNGADSMSSEWSIQIRGW